MLQICLRTAFQLLFNRLNRIQNMSDLFFWCFHVKLTTLLLDVLVQTVNVA